MTLGTGQSSWVLMLAPLQERWLVCSWQSPWHSHRHVESMLRVPWGAHWSRDQGGLPGAPRPGPYGLGSHLVASQLGRGG